jgi:hypothetical protein
MLGPILAVAGFIAIIGAWLVLRWWNSPPDEDGSALDASPGSLMFALQQVSAAGKRGVGGSVAVAERGEEKAYHFVADKRSQVDAGMFHASQQIAAGRAALANHNLQAALVAFQTASAADPPSWEAQAWLGETFTRLGHGAAALHHWTEAYLRHPSCFEMCRRVVMAKHALGQPAESEIAVMRFVYQATIQPHVHAAAAACIDKLIVNGRYAYAYAPLTAGAYFFALFREVATNAAGADSHEGYVRLEPDQANVFGVPDALYFSNAQGRARLGDIQQAPAASPYLALRQRLLQLLEAAPPHFSVQPRTAGQIVEWAPTSLQLEGCISPMALMLAQPAGR